MANASGLRVICTMIKLFHLHLRHRPCSYLRICVVNHTSADNRGICSDLLPTSRGIAFESAHGRNTELPTEDKYILVGLCGVEWNSFAIATFFKLC